MATLWHHRICDAEVEVQQHIRCRHSIGYLRWKWELENGLTAEDEGTYLNLSEYNSLLTRPMLVQYRPTVTQKTETASRVATQSIFRWLRDDGWCESEKGIYTHEWFGEEWFGEESSEKIQTRAVLVRMTRMDYLHVSRSGIGILRKLAWRISQIFIPIMSLNARAGRGVLCRCPQ